MTKKYGYSSVPSKEIVGRLLKLNFIKKVNAKFKLTDEEIKSGCIYNLLGARELNDGSMFVFAFIKNIIIHNAKDVISVILKMNETEVKVENSQKEDILSFNYFEENPLLLHFATFTNKILSIYGDRKNVEIEIMGYDYTKKFNINYHSLCLCIPTYTPIRNPYNSNLYNMGGFVALSKQVNYIYDISPTFSILSDDDSFIKCGRNTYGIKPQKDQIYSLCKISPTKDLDKALEYIKPYIKSDHELMYIQTNPPCADIPVYIKDRIHVENILNSLKIKSNLIDIEYYTKEQKEKIRQLELKDIKKQYEFYIKFMTIEFSEI